MEPVLTGSAVGWLQEAALPLSKTCCRTAAAESTGA